MTSVQKAALVNKIIEHLKSVHGVDRDLMNRVSDDDFQSMVNEAMDKAEDEISDSGKVPSQNDYIKSVAKFLVIALQMNYYAGR